MRVLHYPFDKKTKSYSRCNTYWCNEKNEKIDVKDINSETLLKYTHNEKVLFESEERFFVNISDMEFKLLIDLQTANDCYCAEEFEYLGFTYIFLYGSGWKDLGFPFIREKNGIDISRNIENEIVGDSLDDYIYGSNGRYLILGRKTAKKFINQGRHGFIPVFHDIYSGDLKDLSIPI